ncbi:lytic transglycosylase domain-containing protein [Pantoea cypripedii]|nr:lytic transglycosylase domain-containing protein [Pantoea cypripedii]
MPRLPSSNDLDTVTLRPATGVASADLSAPYRATQQIGNQLTQIGEGLADDENKLELGKAQSDFYQAQTEVHGMFQRDNDYSTMQQRYDQAMQNVTNSAVSGISSGRLKSQFDNWARQQTVQGSAQIQNLAWNKERDDNLAQLDTLQANNLNAAMSTGDEATRSGIIDATNNAIVGAQQKGYITAQQAVNLRQTWAQNYAKGSLAMMTPDQRISALQSGSGVVSFIPPDQRLEMVRNSAFESTELKLASLKQPNADGTVDLNSLDASSDALTNAIFQQESGNKHRNADGSLVTSPKGAQGVGQIMPATGQNPGFGVKPLQDSSEQENRRFTGDYLNAMLKKYDGNQVLALAAYNAGPDNVDSWIKQIGDPRSGQVSNQQFAAAIPVNETRNYVYQVADKATKGAAYQAITDSPDFAMMSPQHQLQVTSALASMRNQDATLSLRRDNAAASAANSIQIRIANGEIPSNNDWNTYNQTVAGTSYDGTTQTLQAITASTQHLFSLPPAQAQAEVDQMMVNLRQNGGNDTQYKVLSAVQSNLNQRRTELQKNPQQVYSLDSGQPLQPLSVDDALQQPGSWGQGLVQRQVNSDAIAQKYGPTAGKNLLTPDELHNTQDAYDKMTSDQRIQFWRNTQASSNPAIATRLAREVGGDSLQVASVAGLANTPDGYSTALSVDKGFRLINPADGAAKVKFGTGFDDDTTRAIKSEYPGLSTMQIQSMLPVVKAYYAGSGGDLQRVPDDDALHKVIGTPIKIGDASIIVPPGSNENAYKDNINTGINKLGEFSQSVRNGLNNGTYTLAPDVDGNQVLIASASQRRVIGNDGRPVVFEVSK